MLAFFGGGFSVQGKWHTFNERNDSPTGSFRSLRCVAFLECAIELSKSLAKRCGSARLSQSMSCAALMFSGRLADFLGWEGHLKVHLGGTGGV